ncbi:single-stranded DNA-binding protein [Georgenia yuyongxinii]
MTIPVQQSLAGFIVSDADVSFTETGISQVRFRVGVEHWQRERDGTFTRLENSFHDLLIFGRTAERAADRFRRGDQFVAHGHVETQYAEPPARPAEREVYVARKIGHDLARTAYDVDRAPATARQTTHQLGHTKKEVVAAVGTEGGHGNGQPSADQDVPPPSSSASLAERTAVPRSSTAPVHGIGL